MLGNSDARAAGVGVPLAPLTTIGLGGPARRLLPAHADEQVIDAVSAADAAGEPLLVIGGGSNLVIGDEGFDGTAVRILTRGVNAGESDGRLRPQVEDGERDGRVLLRAAAGEPWDELVARCVGQGLAGVECLSGIPGLTGATPIQNVGAYGQQVSETIVSVRAYDRQAQTVVDLPGRDCGFAYRASVFRRCARWVVLGVSFALERSTRARPIRYPELARALGVKLGERPPITAVREAVLSLRRSKGMVLDPHDPDSRSVGSFFLNPVLSTAQFDVFTRRVAQRLGPDAQPPGWPDGDGRVKTSAAWLIEQAGFHRGYGQTRVGISGKHTLALVNRGEATTAELVALAQELRTRVLEAFGVRLEPEPTLVGVEL